jgi:hypothetical protein
MPQMLHDLKVNEVSLVDRGACRQCKVAIFKRDDQRKYLNRAEQLEHMDRIDKSRRAAKDDPGTSDVHVPQDEFIDTPPAGGQRTKEKKKMPKLKKILKGEVAATRNERADAFEERTKRIMKREGVSLLEASNRAFEEGYAAYESTPKPLSSMMPVAKREPSTIAKSETSLEDLAREIRKRTGVSMSAAMERACDLRPDLYFSIDGEHLAMAKMQGDFVGQKKRKASSADSRWQDAADSVNGGNGDLDGDDDGDEKCAACKGKMAKGAKFCSECGAEKRKANLSDMDTRPNRGGVGWGMDARRGGGEPENSMYDVRETMT